MIREDQFVERMTAHWRTLGNSPSSALQSVWRQLCSTFNEQATAMDRLWRVAQPATGTGKSQGLALYAAMHHNQPQFGMLIVVRLISQAEEMAEQINHLAHDSIAQCRHTKNVLTTKEMADTQILVVTHKAYELSLEKFKRGDEQRFSTFMAYNHSFEGQRNLVVIDESLNIIKQYQCNLEDLSFALGVIPQAIYQNPEYTKELDALKRLETDLKYLQKSEKVETRVLSTEADHLATHCDFTSLRQEVSQTAWDEHVLQSEDPHYRKSLRERVDKTLEAAQATIEQWHYYRKKGNHHTLNTATLVIPDNGLGAVILDATASQNLLYLLFQEKVMIKPVRHARSYAHVHLHVARHRGIGKTAMKKHAKPRTDALLGYLNKSISPDSKVFLCSHKDLEPAIASYDTEFELKTGHWGAIDGRNDYQHCDTFVAFGLPYRDHSHSVNSIFALKGPQNDAWLQESDARELLGHKDILRATSESQVASDIIQAMNRIRIRRVIDEEGNCAESNCFLILPTGEQGDRILDIVRKAMPGIRTTGWDLELARPRKRTKRRNSPPRSKYGEALSIFLESQRTGCWSAKHLRSILNIPYERWKALGKQRQDPESHLSKKLAALGCRWTTEGSGRGSRTYITKE